MEIPETTFTTATAALLTVLLLALLIAKLITPLERRLVTSAAFLLAGIFLAHTGSEPAATAVGVAAWAGGLGAFLRAGLSWSSAAASRVGPLAVLFLLPPAFFGAVLTGGVAITLLLGL